MLYFIYNADAGKWNGYMDMLHKIVSPKTYPCHLCDITYGVFKIRPEWDAFLKSQGDELVFLHRDEWQKDAAFVDEELPAIFEVKAGKSSVALSAQAMSQMDLAELMAWVEDRRKGKEDH